MREWLGGRKEREGERGKKEHRKEGEGRKRLNKGDTHNIGAKKDGE